jgi:hypothetical protein
MIVVEQAPAAGLKALAPEPEDFGSRVQPENLRCQRASVEIAGRLAARDQYLGQERE